MDRPNAPRETDQCSDTLVIMLDALGARTQDLVRARQLVEGLSALVARTEAHFAGFRQCFPSDEAGVRTVGDCLLIQRPLRVPQPLRSVDLAFALQFAYQWSADVIIGGLMQGVAIRGALAIGPAVWNSLWTLGPAVTDAADWHDKAQVFTAMATPDLGHNIHEIVHGTDGAGVAECFVLYDVPLKCGGSERAWALAWPRNVLRQFDDDAQAAEAKVRELLARCPRESASEAKYANTLAFARHCWGLDPPNDLTP